MLYIYTYAGGYTIAAKQSALGVVLHIPGGGGGASTGARVGHRTTQRDLSEKAHVFTVDLWMYMPLSTVMLTAEYGFKLAGDC